MMEGTSGAAERTYLRGNVREAALLETSESSLEGVDVA